MRIINHRHSIKASSEQVFNWFTNLEKNYLTWHPDSHIRFQWLSDKPIREGSSFIFEERIGSHVHKMVMEVSEILENQRLSFSSVKIEMNSKYVPSWLVSVLISLFRIKMEMHRSFENESSKLTTIRLTQKMGSQIPIINKLVDFVVEHFVISSKGHLVHVEEEASNMKNILEKNI